jgi:hypothetical protein
MNPLPNTCCMCFAFFTPEGEYGSKLVLNLRVPGRLPEVSDGLESLAHGGGGGGGQGGGGRLVHRGPGAVVRCAHHPMRPRAPGLRPRALVWAAVLLQSAYVLAQNRTLYGSGARPRVKWGWA